MNCPRIKICGITRLQDALYCQAAGVEAIGFVFVKKSKRFIALHDALAISRQLGPFITRVGLFLDPDEGVVEAALSAMPELLPQFHGRESAGFCDSFNRPYLKAMGIGSGMPAAETLGSYRNVAGFLFDSNAAGELGGTGHTFDWSLLCNHSDKPLILAGGLDTDNIEQAIKTVNPYAVDVSTGVEQSPGIKDSSLVDKFVTRTRGINQ